MKINLRLAVLPLMLGLAACAAEYSKSEAPDTLRVDGAESRLSIAFAGGSDRLAAGEAARLDRMVVAGTIRPADRVQVAASGPPGLASGAPRRYHASCCATASSLKRWRSARCPPITRSSRSAAMR